MITYTALDGTTKTAEVWCPGPMFGSVWARRGRQYIVVDTRTQIEIEYGQLLKVPHYRPSKREAAWAEEVLKTRRLNPDPDGWIVCDPERDIAAVIWNLVVENDRWDRTVRAGHRASSPVSKAKLIALTQKETS